MINEYNKINLKRKLKFKTPQKKTEANIRGKIIGYKALKVKL